ncbi:hypothetical protein I540_0831 [Mycobacteroides abscessus subsp. bolletii 1513]|uniref:Uncharacterized protein n=1 Tax=Mycobacteroides abscessus subsp. bolletii 1513 TaxID=1299321 RepID=X8E2B1_9MYCO|nr:hypothetical protein I540_0831 [Mycobacteroides abscessus subsp. bolletii 1513]
MVLAGVDDDAFVQATFVGPDRVLIPAGRSMVVHGCEYGGAGMWGTRAIMPSFVIGRCGFRGRRRHSR